MYNMLFNSKTFLVFFVIVFAAYYMIGKDRLKAQNILLLIASYVFYGWWDWRFLSLIFFSSFLDYYLGIQLGNTVNRKKRKWILSISMLANIGLLGFFKYFNFFSESAVDFFQLFGFQADYATINIILPVGISFYTFQTMSYTIDIYYKKVKPTTDLLAFMAFVSFFPQLVAGPIERAKNLLPQFLKKRTFDYYQAVKGMEQILWGFFKKVVVADNAAGFVNKIFSSYETQPGSILILGSILFAFQIYGDFSGYSDIAIGVSRLFGFNLMKNFAFPYFSRDIAEFWRRWHISLSTWFRDYIYIPLGGSKGSIYMKLRNVFIIFIVSGFWHGANWTFIFWGFLNALYFVPLLLQNKNRSNLDVVAYGKLFINGKEIIQIGVTFTLTCFAWIFFRSENMNEAFDYISHIFENPFFANNFYFLNPTKVLLPILILVIFEWLHRQDEFGLDLKSKNRMFRWALYMIPLLMIIYLGAFNKTEFIYFQF